MRDSRSVIVPFFPRANLSLSLSLLSMLFAAELSGNEFNPLAILAPSNRRPRRRKIISREADLSSVCKHGEFVGVAPKATARSQSVSLSRQSEEIVRRGARNSRFVICRARQSRGS